MQAYSFGMHLARYELAEAIKIELDDTIENIYYKSEDTLSYKGNFDNIANGYLIGENSSVPISVENGLKFYVDCIRGQKTGFFIDQRESKSKST